jgi:hypothetical protein
MQGCVMHSNSACAALVANAARLGRAAWAWQVMSANFDQTSDWELPTDCAVPLVENRCPEGETIAFASYPEALLAFLKTTGYLAADFVPPAL